MNDSRYGYLPYGIGQFLPAEGTPGSPQDIPDKPITTQIKEGLHNITPTLIFVGIATGAAFALGSGLIHRYVFKEKH